MTVSNISPRDALADLGRFRLVDVREASEYAGPLKHIAGSKLIPMSDLPREMARWRKNDCILFICRSGVRSTNAALALVKQGYDNVHNLAGGMIAWNKDGLPTCNDSHDYCTKAPPTV